MATEADGDHTAVNEYEEYMRLHRKSLRFGMEELMDYTAHQGEVKEFVQNLNNNVNATWSQKEVHFWDLKTGDR